MAAGIRVGWFAPLTCRAGGSATLCSLERPDEAKTVTGREVEYDHTFDKDLKEVPPRHSGLQFIAPGPGRWLEPARQGIDWRILGRVICWIASDQKLPGEGKKVDARCAAPIAATRVLAGEPPPPGRAPRRSRLDPRMEALTWRRRRRRSRAALRCGSSAPSHILNASRAASAREKSRPGGPGAGTIPAPRNAASFTESSDAPGGPQRSAAGAVGVYPVRGRENACTGRGTVSPPHPREALAGQQTARQRRRRSGRPSDLLAGASSCRVEPNGPESRPLFRRCRRSAAEPGARVRCSIGLSLRARAVVGSNRTSAWIRARSRIGSAADEAIEERRMSKLADQWLEVFRAGDYGDKGSYTPQDLDEMVRNYDPSKHEAPVVIGHPENSAPAFGWVEAPETRGQRAVCEVAPGAAGIRGHGGARVVQEAIDQLLPRSAAPAPSGISRGNAARSEGARRCAFRFIQRSRRGRARSKSWWREAWHRKTFWLRMRRTTASS